MARYEDYLKQREELEAEISEAGDAAQERQQQADAGFELPDKFRGKTPEDVIRSYVELEKKYSQQGETLGQQRKMLDELIAQQLHQPQETVSEPEPELTIDDLYEDPEKAISRIVDRKANKRIEALENEIRQREYRERFGKFENQFPDWRSVGQSQEFNDWVNQSSYRQRMFETIKTTGDVDAATDLFTMYGDAHGGGKKRGRPSKKAIMDASLEGPSATPVTSDEVFSRAELMLKRVQAKQGNRAAAEWMKQNAERIAIAYEEGRIVD